jgi:hypothetical protein
VRPIEETCFGFSPNRAVSHTYPFVVARSVAAAVRARSNPGLYSFPVGTAYMLAAKPMMLRTRRAIVFRSKTLFIVGAGASQEVDLPTGTQLKDIIAKKLNITGNPYSNRSLPLA